MKKFIIDETVCIGCKTCFNSCFVDVYRWDEEKKRPIVAYPEDCEKCNWCVMACPKNCIEILPDPDHKWSRAI